MKRDTEGCIALFRGSWDRHGGAHIKHHVIEVRNNTIEAEERAKNIPPEDSLSIHHVVFPRPSHYAAIKDVPMKVDRLLSGNRYQFRVRADNDGVGSGIDPGPYTEWTEEVTMPELEVNEEDEGSSDDDSQAQAVGNRDEYSDTDSDGDDDGEDTLSQLNRSNLPTTRRHALSNIILPGEEKEDKTSPTPAPTPVNRRGDKRQGIKIDPTQFIK